MKNIAKSMAHDLSLWIVSPVAEVERSMNQTITFHLFRFTKPAGGAKEPDNFHGKNVKNAYSNRSGETTMGGGE